MKKTATKSKLTAGKPGVRRPSCRVEIHPTHAEFFIPSSATAPTSRISNGAEGSHAAAALAQTITTMRRAFNVTVRRFDANAQEVRT